MKIDFLDAFANSKFEVDCLSITLTQNSDNENTIIYQGPGLISQKNEEKFQVKLFCEGKPDIKELFGKINRLTPGKIIEEKNYYSLTASDCSGNTWTASSIMPDITGGFDLPSFLVTGYFSVLNCHKESSIQYTGTTLKLFYKGKHKVPCNTSTCSKIIVGTEERGETSRYNVAQFTINNVEYEILSEDDWLTVYLYSKNEEITEVTAQRVHEALQFILAETCPWDVMLIQKGDDQKTIFRTIPSTSQKSRLQPPLYFSNAKNDDQAWKLFELYINYCSKYSGDDWHPLFVLIHKVIESGKASIEAHALTLAVSIEGLLKLSFSETARPSEEFIAEIKKANKEISNSNIDINIIRRLQGMLSSMKMPRAKDRLYSLQQAGVIEERLVRSWGTIRNGSAHSDSINLSEIQNYINDCSAICVLFYQLIFFTLGYEGEYTDYSVYGYPTKKYGPAPTLNIS